MQHPKRTCNTCGLDKICIPGNLGTSGAITYRDELGRLWKGKRCVECQAKRRSDQRNKAKAALKSESNG